MKELPRGIQPVFADRDYCSVCDKEEVFYETWHTWKEEGYYPDGCKWICTNHGVKRYCAECFIEYGGTVTDA